MTTKVLYLWCKGCGHQNKRIVVNDLNVKSVKAIQDIGRDDPCSSCGSEDDLEYRPEHNNE